MKVLMTLLTLFTFTAQASTVARVLEIKGKAFAFSGESEPQTLKYGDKIEDLSDIMVEDNSQLSLVNTQGHVFHITGGTLLKLYKRNIELKNGQVWTIAKESHKRGALSTTNSIVEYHHGQFVLSFDNISGKSQVLVITGEVKFANSLEPSLNTNVVSGTFSMIDPEYENNLPRTPTKVGSQSFKNLRQNFAGFESLDNPGLDKILPHSEDSGRTIASVVQSYTNKPVAKPKGKLIKIFSYKGTRKPASAMGYYMGIKKQKPSYKTKDVAPIRYFGWKNPSVEKAQVKSVKRVPASIPKTVEPNRLVKELKQSSFDKSLEEKKNSNKKHSDEVNYLIDSLKSYKKDFQKEY